MVLNISKPECEIQSAGQTLSKLSKYGRYILFATLISSQTAAMADGYKQYCYKVNKTMSTWFGTRHAKPNPWNMGNIQNFAIQATAPHDQLMMCLHRGWHENSFDNRIGHYKSLTAGVPDNSWRALVLGFDNAPCVEVDVTGGSWGGENNPVISHESVANRFITEGLAGFGPNATVPSFCRLTGQKFYNGDLKGVCNFPPLLTRDKYTAPRYQDQMPYYADPELVKEGKHKYIYSGYVRNPESQSSTDKTHQLIELDDLLDWIDKCKDVSPIGLLVLDIKDVAGLHQTYSEIKVFLDTIDDDKRRFEISRHLMVKVKPWKMKVPGNTSKLETLKAYADLFMKLRVPIQLTVAQSGVAQENGKGPAKILYGADYDRAREFYKNMIALPVVAMEITAPGTSTHNPITSDTLKIWTRTCGHRATIVGLDIEIQPVVTELNLTSIRNMHNICSGGSIFHKFGVSSPQIWGWIPLDDAAAREMVSSHGKQLDLEPYKNIRNSGTLLYPFGIASGRADPFPFVRDVTDQERYGDYVARVIGARAITLDSKWVFETRFKKYKTDQRHFWQFK